jgi:DNA mismatch repair protein MutL
LPEPESLLRQGQRSAAGETPQPIPARPKAPFVETGKLTAKRPGGLPAWSEDRAAPALREAKRPGPSQAAPPPPSLPRPVSPPSPREERRQTPDVPRLVAGARAEAAVSRFLQIHDAYIIQETPTGFVVIDQHALHERILFHEIREKVARGAVESQHLLLPEPVELTPGEMALIREVTPTLKALGFDLEEFGRHSVVVQAVPAFLKSASAAQVLHDILSELAEGAAPRSLEAARERILSTLACKAAIKAGDPLTPDQIASLLQRSSEVPETIACAHGRPTKLAVDLSELDRQFGRK